MSSLRIAVEGCCHGELNRIYSRLLSLPQASRPDLLLICGDFQALRSNNDFSSIAVPDKYKRLGDFHEYYSGKKTAPIMTIFIGGNHEASNYLAELPYGGRVAPKMYYLGYSGVVWYRGVRIGGWSGIYKSFDFYKDHFENPPFKKGEVRSVYHTRFEDFIKLSFIDQKIDIMVSHDWPEGIVKYGDMKKLIKKKPFFEADIKKGELGSPPSMKLLKLIKPKYWFSAHLHCKFEAVVNHKGAQKRRLSGTSAGNVGKKQKNTDEIDLALDDISQNNDEISLDLEEDPPQQNTNTESFEIDESKSPQESKKRHGQSVSGYEKTQFLALDKCLPNRQFLEYLTIPVTSNHTSISDPNSLYHDEHHLKVIKWFNRFKKREIYRNLKISDIDEDFVGQFIDEVNDTKLDSDDMKSDGSFKADLQNPGQQTQRLVEKFGLE